MNFSWCLVELYAVFFFNLGLIVGLRICMIWGEIFLKPSKNGSPTHVALKGERQRIYAQPMGLTLNLQEITLR